MDTRNELRTSKRVPIESKVQLRARGRLATYALAINVSAGGLLLSAAPSLPVGTTCEVAIPLSDSNKGKNLQTEGTVIRSDDKGIAIRFSKELDENTYQNIVNRVIKETGNSFLNSYTTYFKVSQSDNPADCEKLIGVSRHTFNKVFLTTFLTCIPLSILPVWFFQDNIPALPTWAKISASFAYGLVWIGVIQPSIDLMVFKVIRNKITT